VGVSIKPVVERSSAEPQESAFNASFQDGMIMISLIANQEDDPDYVALVTRIINRTIISSSLDEVFFVQINSWFDYKWLRFSAKISGAFGFYQYEMTVPPFYPNRVIYEMHATFSRESEELILDKTQRLHILQSSEENLKRKITNISKSAIFCWYSSNTKATGKAALMVYSSNSDDQHGWYVSFAKTSSWVVNQMNGISKQEMALLMREAEI
jgi:hypothetical protein